MPRYRKKPVVIEAFQYEGFGKGVIPVWGAKAFNDDVLYYKDKELYIKTLEGDMKAMVSDYIIKGVNGELYPCKPDIFEKIYEKVGD